MKEIWKDIEGFEGRYQISNIGRVKRLYTLTESNSLMFYFNNNYGRMDKNTL